MTTATLTGAQQRSIDKLKKKFGPVFVIGFEPDGVTLRVRIAGANPPESARERLIWPSGLVEEPVA